MIKTIIEGSQEHLCTYKISFLFNEPLKSNRSLYFATFSMKSISHTFSRFGTTHFPKFAWRYQNYYQLPKKSLCSTSCIEINALFGMVNNEGLGKFKIRPNHSMLEGMDAGGSIFKYKCYELCYTELVFQKKWQFSRNTCS